jgi:hypothetical protein
VKEVPSKSYIQAVSKQGGHSVGDKTAHIIILLANEQGLSYVRFASIRIWYQDKYDNESQTVYYVFFIS